MKNEITGAPPGRLGTCLSSQYTKIETPAANAANTTAVITVISRELGGQDAVEAGMMVRPFMSEVDEWMRVGFGERDMRKLHREQDRDSR